MSGYPFAPGSTIGVWPALGRGAVADRGRTGPCCLSVWCFLSPPPHAQAGGGLFWGVRLGRPDRLSFPDRRRRGWTRCRFGAG